MPWYCRLRKCLCTLHVILSRERGGHTRQQHGGKTETDQRSSFPETLGAKSWFKIRGDETSGKLHLVASFISCFCGRDNPPPIIFPAQQVNRGQPLDKSCSQYHQCSSIGCKTSNRWKRRKSSLTRSKILASKPRLSPKAPSSSTSSGLQRDSRVSSVESSPGWSLWTGGSCCSATRSSSCTSCCWSGRSWRKEGDSGNCHCIVEGDNIYVVFTWKVWPRAAVRTELIKLDIFPKSNPSLQQGKGERRTWPKARCPTRAAWPCDEKLEVFVQPLADILTDNNFQVVSCRHIRLHRRWISDQACWLKL